MHARSILSGLAENNAWANQRLHRACAKLTEADRRALRVSFFPTLHGTLTHIVLVDEYYLDALEANGRGRAAFADEDPFASFEPLASAQRNVDRRLIDFVRHLPDEAALDRPVSIVRRTGVETETVGAVLLHLFEHQIHHRGQVHAMLSGTNVPPPQLDEFFLAADHRIAVAELEALGL
jgi:uncharacterized damage-inducible protein DinB